ncbi:MAG: ABC transporter ATP-binding protein [Planctomycetes bacterium]|nr:ABC transporter ATP-binding protein [Planctomycetota bacterium]
MPGTVLKTIDLTKRFGRFTAVDRLSIEVNEGDIFGFLGPNGAGKTTTMRMIVGLVRPTSGRIEVNGIDARRRFLEAIAQIGALVDIPAFYRHLSGRKNLALLARVAGGVPRGRVDEVLEAVALQKSAAKKVKTYSHGMLQRLAIAHALLTKPPLLILDEPTTGLDPEGKLEFLHLLRGLARDERITVFISSHLLDEVEEICNRAAIIKEGRLLVCGEVRSLLAEELRTYRVVVSDPVRGRALLHGRPFVRALALEDDRLLVTTRQEDAAQIAPLLVAGGLALHELSPRQKSLRQVFMELMKEDRPEEAQ